MSLSKAEVTTFTWPSVNRVLFAFPLFILLEKYAVTHSGECAWCSCHSNIHFQTGKHIFNLKINKVATKKSFSQTTSQKGHLITIVVTCMSAAHDKQI